LSKVKGVKKASVIKLLALLNYRYSLRDLQALLGIPYQTLWKYVSLKCMPEERTSKRIAERIEELKLLDKLVEEAVNAARENPYDLVRKPGFLALFTLMVSNALHDVRVGVVVPTSEYALMPATALAMELHCEVCPLLREGPPARKGYYTTHFSECGKSVVAGVPKHCLKDKGRAVLVDVVLNSADKVEAILAILKSARVDAVLTAAVIVSEDVNESLISRGIKVFSLLTSEGRVT